MDTIIENYRCQLEEAACTPGPGRYGLRIVLPNDISEVFPYLNAVLSETVCNYDNEILIGRDKYQGYAFREREIKITGINGSHEVRKAVREAVDKMNEIWRERGQITPS